MTADFVVVAIKPFTAAGTTICYEEHQWFVRLDPPQSIEWVRQRADELAAKFCPGYTALNVLRGWGRGGHA